MNISTLYRLIAEESFPEIGPLKTGLLWEVDSYQIADMKIHEDNFRKWEENNPNHLIKRVSYDLTDSEELNNIFSIQCVVLDYGGSLSLMLGLGTLQRRLVIDASLDSKTLWADRIDLFARQIGKNPSLVILDEDLGERCYRRHFWRWQPIALEPTP